MRKYAILKNVPKGINFGVVVKSDIDQRFYGWSDKGVEWANWANQHGGRLDDLPIGVSIGEFKTLSDELMEKLVINSKEVVAISLGLPSDSNSQILLKSERFANSSKFPSATSNSIPSTPCNKKVSVEYKVKHFRQSIARSEIALKVRQNELAFNIKTRQFAAKPNRASRLTERHDIRSKMSKGSERKFGGQIVDTINKEILAYENISFTKRDNLGSNTKEIVDFFVKGRLGFAIGRGARGVVRGLTPGRGDRNNLRGSASRVIAGILDPRKRRDVDGDGMIFDGTWREMPDPTKFIETIPRRLTRTGERGAASRSVLKTPRADAAILGLSIEDALDAVQRINKGDDFASVFDDLWKAAKGRNDWGDLIADVVAQLKTSEALGKDNKTIGGSIKNIISAASNNLSTSKGHRYESSALASLAKYAANIAMGKDADATDVIASFDDPYAPKGKKAAALEAMIAFGLKKLDTPEGRKNYEGSRGFKSRTGPVIDDILHASEGAVEPEMDNLLRKVKTGVTLKPSESSLLLESLKDIRDNNDSFLGDERLDDLIDHVSGMSAIGKDNTDLVSNLRYILRDRPDPKLSAMLNKYIGGQEMSDKEKASFIESLTNYSKSREFMDDERITNLIDELKSGPKKPSERSGGVASRSMPAPDRERREGLGKNDDDDDDDDDDDKPRRGLRSQSDVAVINDLLERASGTNDFIEGLLEKAKKDISSLTSKETENLIEAVYDEYANATQGLAGDKRLLQLIKNLDKHLIQQLLGKRNLSRIEARKIMADSKISNDAGGDDLDSGIRRVATALGLGKKEQDTLSELIYNIDKGNAIRSPAAIVDSVTKNPRDRDTLNAAIEEFINPEPRRGLASTTTGQFVDMKKERREKYFAGIRQVDLKKEKREREALRKKMMAELDRVMEQIRSRGPVAPSRGLRSSTDNNDDLGSDMDDAIQAIIKLKRGEKLTPEEQKTILQALNVIKKPNSEIDEDQRVDLIDLEASVRSSGISSRTGSSTPSRKNGGLRSRTFEEIKEMAEGAGEDDFISMYEKFIKGDKLTPDEQAELTMTIRNILDNNPDISEDQRLDLIDLYSDLKRKRGIGIRSRTFESIKEMAEGAGEDDFINNYKRFIEGKELSPEDTAELAMTVRNILDNNPDITEDERADLIDLLTDLRGRRGDGIRSRTFESIKEMAEGAGEDDFISAYEKFIKGKKLAPEEQEELVISVRNILDNNPDITEDERADLIDLLTDLKSNKSRGGVSSSTSRRQVNQPLSSRMATAVTDRASRPRGLSSSTDTAVERTPVDAPAPKKVKRRQRLLIDMTDNFGKTRGEGDGVLWESMTEDERKLATEALAERKKFISDQIKKKIFKKWWQKATEEGLDKQSLRAVKQRARGTGGKYEMRKDDDPLNMEDITTLLTQLDEEVRSGRLKQYKIDESGKVKLDKNGKPIMTETYGNAARYLDDMMTILNMEGEGDFSLLEHLHTGSRDALHRKIKTPKTGKFKMGDSSVAGYAGGLKKAESADELSDAELGKAKKLSIGRRILRVNDARAAKVRARALRKTGQFRKGRILASGDPELEMKRARLRARALKRTMISKFRRTRDADGLSKDMSKSKAETGLVAIDDAGKVTVSKRYVETLSRLDKDLKDGKGSEESTQRVYDQLLADLWANSGQSGQPVLVTEEEGRRLIAAGWQPIIRGTGSEEVESEGYVEQFLTDKSETRFIPGKNGRMYGVGEYFAFPGNWAGYRGTGAQRHSILVFIPPSADVVTRGELQRERNKMRQLTEAAINATKTLGGREVAAALSPGELSKTLREALPDLDKETSRSGQIVNQIISRLDALEDMPMSDEVTKEKKDILNALDYLSRFTKQNDEGYFAPLIGVDGIDTNENGDAKSPYLLHNRSNIAAFQKPITSDEAERMAKDEQGNTVKNIIGSWKTRTDRSREGSQVAPSRPSRTPGKRRPSTRRPAPDGSTTTPTPSPTSTPSPVQAPTPTAVPTSKSAVSTDSWSESNPPSTGSNPATMLTDANGTKYYAKLPKRGEPKAVSQERMETEVLAGKLYELAGVPVADLQMGTRNSNPVMLSRMIQTRMPSGKGDNDKIRDGFVVDAWLANWDAPLNDNIKVDNNGRPVRLDVGGSLDYRAQGAKKGSGGSTGFGPNVGEMTSMQKSGTSADFTNMDAGELKKQTQKLGTVTDDQIRKTVSAIVTDPARAKILADTLIARRDDIIKRYG